MYMYKYIYETQLLHSFQQTFENSIDVLLILLLIFNHWRTYVFMQNESVPCCRFRSQISFELRKKPARFLRVGGVGRRGWGPSTYREGLSPWGWSSNVQKSRYAVVVRVFASNSPHMYIDPMSHPTLMQHLTKQILSLQTGCSHHLTKHQIV